MWPRLDGFDSRHVWHLQRTRGPALDEAMQIVMMDADGGGGGGGKRQAARRLM